MRNSPLVLSFITLLIFLSGCLVGPHPQNAANSHKK